MAVQNKHFQKDVPCVTFFTYNNLYNIETKKCRNFFFIGIVREMHNISVEGKSSFGFIVLEKINAKTW